MKPVGSLTGFGVARPGGTLGALGGTRKIKLPLGTGYFGRSKDPSWRHRGGSAHANCIDEGGFFVVFGGSRAVREINSFE